MTSHQGQLQTLINEIEALLGKATPRLPWMVAGEANQQRRVLEQARDYLQHLKAEGEAPAGWGPLSPGTGEIAPAVNPAPLPPLEANSQQILQALLQEMQYLRSQTLQPLRNEVSLLQQQREQLLQEVRQLELERFQLGGSRNPAPSFNPALVDEVVQRLQESLFSQLNPQIQALKAQVNDPAALYGTGDSHPAEPGDLPQLHPSQRLEQLRRIQAQTDYMLLKLDTNLRAVFESMEQSIQSYRDSLHQGLDTMHGLGQQGEVIFKALINHLAQQLGQAPYLDTAARDRAARLTAAEDRYGLDAAAEVVDSGDRWQVNDTGLSDAALDAGAAALEDEDLPSWPQDLDLEDTPLDIDDLDLDADLDLEASEEVTLFQLDEEITQLQLDESADPEMAWEDDDAFLNDRFDDEDDRFDDGDEATVIQREPIPWPVAIGQRPATGEPAPPPEEDHAEIDALYESLFGTVEEVVEDAEDVEATISPADGTEPEARDRFSGEDDGDSRDRPASSLEEGTDGDLDRSLDAALLDAPALSLTDLDADTTDLAGDDNPLSSDAEFDALSDLEDITLPELASSSLDGDPNTLEDVKGSAFNAPDPAAETAPLADWLFAGAPAEEAGDPPAADPGEHQPAEPPADPSPSLAALFGESEEADRASNAAAASPDANTITSLADLLPTPGAVPTGQSSDMLWEQESGEDSFIPAPPDEDLLAVDAIETPPAPDLELSSDVLEQLNADLLGLEGLPPEDWQQSPLGWPAETGEPAPPEAPALDTLFEAMEPPSGDGTEDLEDLETALGTEAGGLEDLETTLGTEAGDLEDLETTLGTETGDLEDLGTTLGTEAGALEDLETAFGGGAEDWEEMETAPPTAEERLGDESDAEEAEEPEEPEAFGDLEDTFSDLFSNENDTVDSAEPDSAEAAVPEDLSALDAVFADAPVIDGPEALDTIPTLEGDETDDVSMAEEPDDQFLLTTETAGDTAPVVDHDTPLPETSSPAAPTDSDWQQWQELAADAPPPATPTEMVADWGNLLGETPPPADPPVDLDSWDQLGAAFDAAPDTAPEAADLSSWDDLAAAFGEESADADEAAETASTLDAAPDLGVLAGLQNFFTDGGLDGGSDNSGEAALNFEADFPFPDSGPEGDPDTTATLDDFSFGEPELGTPPETATEAVNDTLDDWAIAFDNPDLPNPSPSDEDIHLSLEGMSFELDLPPIPPTATPAPADTPDRRTEPPEDPSLSSAGLLGELMGTDSEMPPDVVDEPPPASADFGWDDLGASLEPDLPSEADDDLPPAPLDEAWGASTGSDLSADPSEPTEFSLGDLNLDLNLGDDFPASADLELAADAADLDTDPPAAASVNEEDISLNLDASDLNASTHEDVSLNLDASDLDASPAAADMFADFGTGADDPLGAALGMDSTADPATAANGDNPPSDRKEIELFPTATDEDGEIDEALDFDDDDLRDLFPPTGFIPSPLEPEEDAEADPIDDFLAPAATPDLAPDPATADVLGDWGDEDQAAGATETTATTAALLAIADHGNDGFDDPSEGGEWFLGIDLGTIGLSAVLMNRSDGQAYPLYWTDAGLAGATTETIFRLPTSVSLAKTGAEWTAQAVGAAALTLDWAGADATAPLLVTGLKPLLATGIPHQDDHGNPQPYVQWSDRHHLPLSTLLAALEGLLATMQVPATTAVTATIGAAGLTLGELATALNQLQGVVVGYPHQGSDTYRLNVREAVLQTQLVAEPSQVFFVDEAIAAILSGLPDPHQMPNTANPQTQTLYQCNWQGGTVVISAGASATELGLVDLPHPLAALTAEDFALRTLAYGGDALDLDIISHLLAPPERRQRRPIGSNRATTTGWHWEATLPENAEVHWDSLGLDTLDLPRLAEPDRDARLRLRRRLEASPLGQSLLEATRHLKLILQNQAQFHLELGDQSWRVLRRDLENRILVPYIQRINQNLNGLMSQTGLSAQGIKQVICTGGNASFGTIAKWLRQKFPNATIIQDTYPTQRPASCSRVAYGLVNLCRYPQVLDGPRHQYSDYFLLHEILRVAPDAPMPLSGLLHLLEEQGVNTEVCQQRVVALLEGHLPPGLVPDAATRSHLSPATLDTALYRALATESLFSHQSGQIYVLNSSHRQRLRQHLTHLMADKHQSLAEPLMAQLVLP